jgi:phage terminase large subunit-like protein
MTRGEKVIAFIERYCVVPDGVLVGKPIKLLEFQRKFILEVYDNPVPTRRAYLSIGRKNGKTALIACLLLAHLVGPEARLNSQIISGARSREQASLVFKLARKMVMLSPELSKIIRVVPSGKELYGLPMNVEYKAISAEAGTAHGLSPVVSILDEVGQVKGPVDAFVEAIETSQGAHNDPILFAISTQAATDDDMFSRWLDDALTGEDPSTVCHLYAADPDCEIHDREAWAAANPGLGKFRSLEDLAKWADRAERMPSDESTFRWLYLNQRVEATDPYVSKSVWEACGGQVLITEPEEWFGGLDLSSVNDLCAYVRVGWSGDRLIARSRFWLPGHGIKQRSRDDRQPYDVWAKEGFVETTPGKTIDYDYVAPLVLQDIREGRLHRCAFDRWGWRFFRAALLRAGATEEEVGTDESDDQCVFKQFGQGFQSMSPALRVLDERMLNGNLFHYDNPVLTMCAKNAVVKMDPAGNRKLIKLTRKRRIDGMIALAMATSLAGDPALEASEESFWEKAS